MVFDFRIFGLVIVLILLYVHFLYNKKDNVNKLYFNYILFAGYFMEFLHIIAYIFITNDFPRKTLVAKIYLNSLILYILLLIGYLIIKRFSDIYKNKDTELHSRIYDVYISIIIASLISLGLLFACPISVSDKMISGLAVNVAYIVMLIYIFAYILLYFIFNRSENVYRNVFISGIICLISLIFQYCINDISIITNGFIISLLYLYITMDTKSGIVDDLEFERDSAIKLSNDTNKFLSNMSYEIRTPLNAIDGLSQVIEDSNDINAIKEDAKDIRIASKNLIDIINGIIDISSIDMGKFEIFNDNYDPMTMFDNICDIAKSRIQNENVKFKFEISDNLPKTLSGDSDRIEQVILNLIENSIEYTEKGSILFKVEVINSSSLCRLKMTVSDTGRGIKEEELKNLFERDIKSSDEKLGLIIVKKLVSLMNGKIDVSSTFGKGSTFTVVIDQKVITDKVVEDKKENISMFDATGKRVLVVDDNKLNLKVADKMLSQYNVDVLFASSGQECIDLLENDHNFDLILMDDMMPNMSGTEALGVIKKIERVEGYNIPIVVLTANAIAGMKDKYLKAGFEDFLSKPIDKVELNRILNKFLNEKK